MELLSIENLFTLAMLVLLQAVLGFDNLLYISLESKRVDPTHQASVRRWGIGLALALRIALLFVLVKVISLLQNTLFEATSRALLKAHLICTTWWWCLVGCSLYIPRSRKSCTCSSWRT